MCWEILNLNWTLYPNLLVDLVILTSKQPSPVTKPDNQLGSGILIVLITGLSTGIYNLNWFFKKSDKPKLIEALILIIWFNPSTVKWFLF